jgi:hypothetical protein
MIMDDLGARLRKSPASPVGQQSTLLGIPDA